MTTDDEKWSKRRLKETWRRGSGAWDVTVTERWMDGTVSETGSFHTGGGTSVSCLALLVYQVLYMFELVLLFILRF